MSKKHPFNCYSFIKREGGNWVSLGLIQDETVGDFQRFDYTLPMSGGLDRTRAEALALSMLADTAKLSFPVQGINNIKVSWRVSSDATRNCVLNDGDILAKLGMASPYWDVCLMSAEQQEVFEKEISDEANTDSETE